ncbi:MAG: hypothetical protein ACYC6L_16160 [Anaerolineae bacterium]
MTFGTTAFIGMIIAFVLTLAVFSRLLGDNIVYRFVQCLFIGLTSGYILALVMRTVIWPRVLLLIQQPMQYWHYGVFFALGLLLLSSGLSRAKQWASLPLGILFGLGAALTLGGALAGTLIPQTYSLVTSLQSNSLRTNWSGWLLLLNGILVIIGTLAVLGSFQVALPGRGMKVTNAIWTFFGRTLGRGLIMVTLGALYAGALVSFFPLLVGRFMFIRQTISDLIHLIGVS